MVTSWRFCLSPNHRRFELFWRWVKAAEQDLEEGLFFCDCFLGNKWVTPDVTGFSFIENSLHDSPPACQESLDYSFTALFPTGAFRITGLPFPRARSLEASSRWGSLSASLWPDSPLPRRSLLKTSRPVWPSSTGGGRGANVCVCLVQRREGGSLGCNTSRLR